MNIKRIVFWLCFAGILGLIVWGLIVAMNRPVGGLKLAAPAAVSEVDHAKGPIDAPVTLVEYSDYQCPACELYYPVVEKLLASSTVPIRFVYRHFPLTQHKNAIPAAMAAEAAGVQGKYWEMHDLLFSRHTEWTELSDPTSIFKGYADKIGLDAGQFATDISSSTLRAHIEASQDEGIHIGVNATPTFFVNGKAITNPQSYEAFASLIQEKAAGGTR